MLRATYISDKFPNLTGRTALLRIDKEDSDYVWAQFDDRDLILAFGWTKFNASDFEIEEEEQ